jgi:thiol-disulfide isomerase/thioredoxin
MRTMLLSLGALHCISLLAQANNYPPGSTVPNFITLDTDGIFHTLYDYTAEGKTVMLDFYFYDCVPCQEYAPDFSELYAVCFHVNAGVDSEAQADQFVIDFGGDGPHPPVITPFNGGLLVDQFGVGAYPTLCVIAPDNSMWNNDVWPITLETMQADFPDGANIPAMNCTVGQDRSEQFDPFTINLLQAQPRPVLAIELGSMSTTTLRVVDPLGRCVVDDHLGVLPQGRSTYMLPADLAMGTYLLQVYTTAGSRSLRFLNETEH